LYLDILAIISRILFIVYRPSSKIYQTHIQRQWNISLISAILCFGFLHRLLEELSGRIIDCTIRTLKNRRNSRGSFRVRGRCEI